MLFKDDYGEFRDSLDHRYSKLIDKVGFRPIPLITLDHKSFYDQISYFKLDGLLLSGGNDLAKYNNKTSNKKRDYYEDRLIKLGIKKNIPIFGICRGFQKLNHFFGGTLKKINDHVKKSNLISINYLNLNRKIMVKCYHNYGIPLSSLSKEFNKLALDKNSNVEAALHKKKKILGIMWHPERQKKITDYDIKILKNFFK